MSKEIRVSDIIDAIEQNGYRRIRGQYFRIKKEKRADYFLVDTSTNLPKKEDVSGACALGQAALNLGIPVDQLLHGWSESAIYGYNDRENLSCAKTAQKYRAKYPEMLDKVVLTQE